MFFFKQKTAYEMRISDWSSDVCSSDLTGTPSSSASHVSPSPACGRGRREAPGEGAAFDVAGQKPGPHPNPSPEGGRGATDRSIRSARYARSEERRGGKECIVRLDLGCRLYIKKKTINYKSIQTT